MLWFVLGGLGLFLLGMSLLTAGLKLAGGSALQGLLTNWTSTRPRAFVTGFGATTMVQSSSAVTVSIIGFVNAGLLDLRRSLWLVFGSNVGSTTTAWIVAMIGLKIKVDVIALPAIGVGTLIHLFGTNSRWRAMGGALAGLGLVFLGLQYMQDAFAGLEDHIDLGWLGGGGVLQLVGLILVGAVMTALMQSSAASMAIVLTAVSTGLLSLNAGAAAVIGANIGTTITAGLAVIKATAAARRVAMAHLVFNLVTATAALFLLGFMLATVIFMQQRLDLDPNPAVSLALFHTLFNLTGTALMLPLESRLARWLEGLFISPEEEVSVPRFLDKSTAKAPDRALAALALEARRLLTLAGQLACHYSRVEPEQAREQIAALQRLINRINDFVVDASADAVPTEVSRGFQEVITLNINTSNMLENLADMQPGDVNNLAPEHGEQIHQLALSLGNFAQRAESDQFGTAEIAEFLEAFELSYDQILDTLGQAAQHGRINMRAMERASRYLATLRRVVRQYGKALRSFKKIDGAIDGALASNTGPEQSS